MSENKKFLSYGRQEITEQDIAAVVQVLKGDFLTQGPAVEAFEAAFAKKIGCRHAVAVSNGTAGLHVAAMAADLKKGDAAFVPVITFAATSNAVLYNNATPIFVDIDPSTGCMDVDSLERAYQLARKEGLKPRAVLPVHYAGKPCDMRRIWDFAKSTNLIVIEDACHALGAEISESKSKDWQKVGSSSTSFAAVFSFHPVKHITTGEGGMVTTNDDQVAKQLRALRSHGITKNSVDYVNRELAYNGDGELNAWYHEMQILGFNYRICDIQAALGANQIQRLDANISRRREIASKYREGLAGIDGLTIACGDGEHDKHSYHLFPLRIDFRKLGLSRNAVMKQLALGGVGTQVHYIPVPFHPFYKLNTELWRSDDLSHATSFYEQELSIPMYSTLSDSEVARVVTSIRRIFSN